MILVQTKADSTPSLGLALGKEKDQVKGLSFSELLRGAKDSKEDPKLEKGSFLIALTDKTGKEEIAKDTLVKDNKLASKGETLSSLLKNDEKLSIKDDLQVLELNPKITQNMSVSDMKVLIADAKKYLKNKILESVEYKKAQTKEIPQTLKGLVDVAKKFGIDISKITLEEVKPALKNVTNEAQVGREIKPAVTAKHEEIKSAVTAKHEEIKSAVSAKHEEIKSAVSAKNEEIKSVATKTKDEIKSIVSIKHQEIKAVVSSTKEEIKSVITETKQETASFQKETKIVSSVTTTEIEAEDTDESKLKLNKSKVSKVDSDQETVQEIKVKKEETKEFVKDSIRVEDKKLDTLREIKSTPLFKVKEKFEHTTEQIVQVKTVKVEDKTSKSRVDETLKSLLRGERPLKIESTTSTTKELSIATARVITPEAKVDVTKSFEQLLRGDTIDDVSKPESVTTQKAESFEVKINEAKQMVKYLSHDIKNAIEDYKSPFTRVKVQLNPQKMGEVDLTVVQRGNNLHVNLSSNNAAINTLAMNLNDLRVQLNNNGIQNATFNFNDSSQQSGEQQSSGHKDTHSERKANEEYNYFDEEEQHEEILSSLEIVVPAYA